MVVTFLGTRGEIDLRSRAHRRHSSLGVEAAAGTVMIDCGLDWSRAIWNLAPIAILLTHAHPDHAGGLRGGSPCPVFATSATFEAIARYSIIERRPIEPRVLAPAGRSAVRGVFPLEPLLRPPPSGGRR